MFKQFFEIDSHDEIKLILIIIIQFYSKMLRDGYS